MTAPAAYPAAQHGHSDIAPDPLVVRVYRRNDVKHDLIEVGLADATARKPAFVRRLRHRRNATLSSMLQADDLRLRSRTPEVNAARR